MLRFFYAVLLIIFSHQVAAWEDHALLTSIVLKDWIASDKLVARYLDQTVKPESLKSFLIATKATLPLKMHEIEHWARNNESGYQFLPDNLVYQPSRFDCASDLEVCFKKAVRMNLDVPLKPIIYDTSNYYSQQQEFTKITDLRKIMPAYIASTYNLKHITLIPVNAKVRIADLISTGSAQPDFGFDIFLYEDSQTSFGKIYGFGKQPIGNPVLPFNSQMLFHMSAYHDDRKILALIPRLNEEYAEYRAFLYLNLSRFAAKNNHPYWAALFLGWGLHYIQDMTQPYHGKIAYGLNTNIVLQAIAEMSKQNYKPFVNLETLQFNRHIILENLTNTILSSSVDNGFHKKTLYRSLMDKSSDAKVPPCNLNVLYLHKQVSLNAINITPNYESILQAAIPSFYINNPGFHAESTMNFNKLYLQEMSKSQRLRFSEALAQSLRLYGMFTRACIVAYSHKA